MKIAIHHDGKYGFVHYNKGDQEVMVTHPNPKVRNTVRHYLTNERTFIVPGDDNINHKGNRLPVQLMPNKDEGTMQMALCEMFHNTGVHVDWGHEENGYTSTPLSQPDPNAQADKPIVKSVFGDEGYEIIN